MHQEHHLEQRAAALVAHRLQGLDQPVEGEILAGVGAERLLPRALQELAEGEAGGEVAGEHQGVDEEADQPLELGPAAAGHGRAHHDPLLSGVAMEQRLEGREQGHEQGRSRPLRQPPEFPGQLGGKLERTVGAPIGLDRRPRPVGGQAEIREGGPELPLPFFQQPLARLAQRAPLPGREVRNLERQLGQRRGPAGGEGRVELPQLPLEDLDRPAVGHDVVHGGEEHASPRRRVAAGRRGTAARGQGRTAGGPPRRPASGPRARGRARAGWRGRSTAAARTPPAGPSGRHAPRARRTGCAATRGGARSRRGPARARPGPGDR